MASFGQSTDAQADIIAFLSQPSSYQLSGEKLEIVETHCSIIFLAGSRAYKLKRAIRYAALDYTTPELRRAACVREVVLNQRTAPELYLGVRSINRDEHGQLAFDGPGVALDTVVVMRRFQQGDLFDRMAEAGRLTPDLMHTLGRTIGAFHAAAETVPLCGGSEAIRRVIADNDYELGKVAEALDGAAVHQLRDRCGEALTGVVALLDRRRATGGVRHAHGDLRLANICLYNHQPTLFDCIEFSEEIGCIDTLYDLAFLLMDLLLRGSRDFANRVFNGYLDVVPEAEGLRAMPLFLALRAATRSYALAGAARRQASAARSALLCTAARAHIDAALEFLKPSRPALILVDGPTQGARIARGVAAAGLALPAPGARILQFISADAAPWDDAEALLAAGCAVVMVGPCATPPVEAVAAAVAGRHRVRLEALWSGPTPPARALALPWIADTTTPAIP